MLAGVFGGALLVRAALHLIVVERPPLTFALFVILAVAAELWQLELSFNAMYSVGLAISLASAVVFGVEEAIVVSAIGMAAGDIWKRRPLYKKLFNATMIAITVSAGGAVLGALRASPRTQLAPSDLPALGAYAVAHLAVNLALVSTVIGLATRTRPWDVALANYRGLFIPITALYPLGVLMSVTYIHFGGWVGLLLLAVPTVAVYSALNRAQQLRAHTRAALEALADALDRRDRYTAEHSRRVAEYVDGIAQVLKLSLAERELVVAAARVHDLGKISTPDAIWRKQAPLDDAEWQVMREHPGAGAAILSHLPMYKQHARLVGSHHEREDGAGYPQQLGTKELPLGAQILSVADAYDAMTSDRPYRQSMSPAVALSRLREGSGSQFRADVVDALARALGLHERSGPALQPALVPATA